MDVESKDNLPTDLNILRISGLVDVTDGLIVLTKAGIQEIAAILSAVPENLVIPIPPVLELSDAVKPNIGILGVSFNSEFGKITREGMDGDVYLGKKECALFEVIYNSGETGVARHILQARCTGNVAGLIDAINKKIGKFSIMLGKNARSGPTVLKLKG